MWLRKQVAYWLLMEGADCRAVNQFGDTPLHFAARWGHAEARHPGPGCGCSPGRALCIHRRPTQPGGLLSGSLPPNAGCAAACERRRQLEGAQWHGLDCAAPRGQLLQRGGGAAAAGLGRRSTHTTIIMLNLLFQHKILMQKLYLCVQNDPCDAPSRWLVSPRLAQRSAQPTLALLTFALPTIAQQTL